MPRPKKRRSRGQIQSRGLDKWLVRIFRGADPVTGKRIYTAQTVDGSKKDAEKALTEMLRELDTGTFIEPSKVTLGAYLEKWLETKTDVTASTLSDYRTRLRKDVIPYIGPIQLDQLNAMHVDTLYNKTLLKERGLGGRTIQYTHTVFRMALEQAVHWGLLRKNPTDRATLPKTGRKQALRYLTPEQARTLLEKTRGTPYGALWTVLLTTGLRPQEALALKWSDLEGSSVIVRRVMRRGERQVWVPVEATKTAQGRRKVLLPPQTLAELAEYRIWLAKQILRKGKDYNREGDWMFPNRNGSPLHLSWVRRKWQQALSDAGLPAVRLYDARHTHATTLLLSRVPAKVVSERLGHSRVGITLDVYSHVLPEMQEQAAAAIGEAFFAPKEAAK
jgi:integrase